jgi:hypothetical protein
MLTRWDATKLTILCDHSEPSHILGYSECLHAQTEMGWLPPTTLTCMSSKVRSALEHHCAEDIVRFDASRYIDELPQQAYCQPCGEFAPGGLRTKDGGVAVCPNIMCAQPLRMESDFEFLCESLVWTSVFRELKIAPMHMADARVSLENVLGLMKHIRPYQSLETRGANSYKLQCYFITHLTFILTRWGAVAMTPRQSFVEEYIFLISNMDVVIKWKDPELVGEFLQALHILDTPHSHPAMMKGYHYLLRNEKKGKMRGNWVPHTATYYQRYMRQLRRGYGRMRRSHTRSVRDALLTSTPTTRDLSSLYPSTSLPSGTTLHTAASSDSPNLNSTRRSQSRTCL